MLKSKSDLVDFLRRRCEKIVFNNEICTKIREYLLEQYNIPVGTTMDMIARSMLDEQTEFVLFCLTDGIDNVFGHNYKVDYFTDIEINQYSKEKINTDKLQFPIKIKCIQVKDDQWIGATDSNFIMELRKAQMIRYNVNAQRVMKRIIRGESILFKIVPNKLAIKAIKSLMQTKMYIPTTITLNIPYDSDAEFYYDSSENMLIIKSLDSFDISDGYHRYLAMSDLCDSNSEFVYPMEIRIINFTEEKTRQFIFQEDQKTKMTQTSSKSMNINRPSNSVIDRLNEMSTFDFKGQIGRNEGTIDYGIFSDFIEYFYFKERRNFSNADIRNIANEIKNNFNALSEYDAAYINKILGFRELAVIFHIFSIEKDLEKASMLIDKVLKGKKYTEIKRKQISKALFENINKLL